MGALDYKTRRHRRTRMAAEMYATWTPRRLFTFGTSVGGAHWFTDPNTLYRRRNRLTYTRDFSNAAAWTRTNILSVTADADGVGDLVVPNTTLTTHAINQASAVTAGATTTYVVRAKPGGYDFVILSLGGASLAYFDVSAGTLGTATNAISTSIAAAADAPGYYDCTLVAIPTSANCFVYAAQTNGVASFAGDGTSGVYLARAQLETYTTTASEYQDVPTTWPEAYLAAVGAENIYAWTDNAGTTPVTAAGDTIGLSLDRAYGGRTDGSLIASGATGLTGTATAASYNTSTGAGSVSRAGDASNQSWVTWTGLTTSAIHRIRVTNTGATSLDVRNGSVSGTIVASIAAGATSYVHPLTSGGSTSITITATNNSTTATFTVLEFARVPGTHLIQATGTARPTLSARVNMLTYTEQFDNAAWIKRGTAAVVANATTDPLGGSTADQITVGVMTANDIYQQATFLTGASAVPRLSIKRISTSGTLRMANPATAAAGDWRINLALLSDGWETITATHPAVTVVTPFTGFGSLCGIMLGNVSAANLSFYAWGADLRTADDASKAIPAYQRVGATAADHDTDGFPHYALFDGTDDSWASAATVDGSGSNKLTVVAGATKNSDAATGMVMEFTANVSSNNGSFWLAAPLGAAANLGFTAKGTLQGDATSGNTFAAPTSRVLTGAADISGGTVSLRSNAVSAATHSAGLGTGNFANSTLYVGSRAGSSLRFNGRIYSLVGRFGAMSDTDRNRLEQWTKNLMRLP